MADRPPDDLRITIAWGDLFSEFRPFSAAFHPPESIAVIGVAVALIGGLAAVWLATWWLVVIWILVGQTALIWGLYRAYTHRSQRTTRLLLKLTPERIEMRWKLGGIVSREKRVDLDAIGEVRLLTWADEPELWLMLVAGGHQVVPMRGALPSSAAWLQARIEERRLRARDRRGSAREVPPALRAMVEGR